MYAMFRNTINISPPTRGWGQTPDANDNGKADDIERIRIYRNKISHENSSDMTTNDFNKSALDLIWVILNIILQRHESLSILYELVNNQSLLRTQGLQLNQKSKQTLEYY